MSAATARAPSPVEILSVTDRAGMERFIRLPHDLMRHDPAWVPPLRLERREALSPAKNPWWITVAAVSSTASSSPRSRVTTR